MPHEGAEIQLRVARGGGFLFRLYRHIDPQLYPNIFHTFARLARLLRFPGSDCRIAFDACQGSRVCRLILVGTLRSVNAVALFTFRSSVQLRGNATGAPARERSE